MENEKDDDIAKLFHALVEEEGLDRDRVERALKRFQEARKRERSGSATERVSDDRGNDSSTRGR
jgi:hypothetical protein